MINENAFEFELDAVTSDEFELDAVTPDEFEQWEIDLSDEMVGVVTTPPILSISLDGEPLEPDENKNVNIQINLADINSKLADFESTKSKKIAFTASDFVLSGIKYKLTYTLTQHERGYDVFCENVFRALDGDYKDVLFQQYVLPNGSLIIVTDESFNGYIIIKGV